MECWIEAYWREVNTGIHSGVFYHGFCRTNSEFSLVFVAMWFDDFLIAAWEHGFEPAIADVGYKPIRASRIQPADRIDDRIIADIRCSRFVYAAFTHGKYSAVTHSEIADRVARFAHGLGIDVIFTCRKFLIEYVHFDMRQCNHIIWECPENLQNVLTP